MSTSGVTANSFGCIEPKRRYRHIAVTDRRTRQDYAQKIKRLVDEAYPEVKVIDPSGREC